MRTVEVAAGNPMVEPQDLESYEPPTVLEVGTVEDLTWTSSFDVSTGGV